MNPCVAFVADSPSQMAAWVATDRISVEAESGFVAPPGWNPFLQDVVSWVDDNKAQGSMLWLRASQNAVRRAASHSITSRYRSKDEVIASFFFPDLTSAPTEKTEEGSRCPLHDCLIPTIVWQKIQKFPETKTQVHQQFVVNTELLYENWQTQMDRLFLQPLHGRPYSLRKLYRKIRRKNPRLVVIDGLEQCGDQKAQTKMLKVFADAAAQSRIPLLLLVTSKPDPHLLAAFANAQGDHVQFIDLDERFGGAVT